MPAQSDMRLGDEELLGPNQIGYVCAFAFFLAQHLLRRREGRWWLAALFLGITVLRSLSKTTIAAFLVAECFFLMQDKAMSRKTKLWIGVAAVVMVLAFWGLLSAYFDTYTSGTDPESLTGRVGIWTVVLDAALTQPWIGHGFHSVWKVIPPFGPQFFEARHAHNELLQQFYAYGVAGIILLAGAYGSLYWQLRRLPKSPWKTFVLGMLLFALVRGLADTEPFDLSLPLWFILLASVSTDSVGRLSEEATQPDAGPEFDTGFTGVSAGLPTV
jgi:oligosaccharide repeat unit polymerase